ncbi:hypothetical protein K439DRAFT_1633097 [Ramaria rubella]|nr:hypothetical protein K439DRAFT_1633097 [Ramaria rubella]
MNPRERAVDPLARLRLTLENMGLKKYHYSPQVRTEILTVLYDALWGVHVGYFIPGATATPSMQTWLSEVQAKFPISEPPVPGRPCGRIFEKGECCYRCKDCSLDDSSVMCSPCFRATDHDGHNITFYITQQPGGCCDCGDPESWRIPPNCPYHPPTELDQRSSKNSTRILDIWSPTKHPTRVSVPLELRETLGRTIAYALDFVLDTLDYSPDDAIPPHDEDELRFQQSADPIAKEYYAVLLWNDDRHSFEEVIQSVCEATGCSREVASDVTNRIDEEGRDIIEMSDDVMRLLDIGTRLHQIELGVTIRRTFDTFREQIAVVIIEWLLDLTRCRLGTDPLIFREIISAELFTPRKRDSSSLISNHEATKLYAEVDNPARLDWLFLYHTRLWKKPRLNLKQMYVSILNLSHDHKIAVASHFSSVYHRIVDSFLLIDRDADTSVKYFALQLFTVPSIAAHVVRNHGIIPRLLGIITAFFTNQISGKRVEFPPDPDMLIDVEAAPFKSKRFMPIFSDLRYICANQTVQGIITQNPEFIVGFSRVCQMFMGINPNLRAVSNHVEYETDAWISVFNVTLSLSRVVKAYGEAYSKATAAELVDAIATVVHHILVVCTMQNDRLDRTKYKPIIFHTVEFDNNSYQIVDFDVLKSWISFHHALHWLLAELFKHVDTLSSESLLHIGLRDLRDVVLRTASEQAVLTLIDFPLRVLVMIAQIRTGLWVRNGFAIRGQLLHYRDFMLRELCYDQDIFILQSAFVILDPDVVLVSILDRFQLLPWFSGDVTSVAYSGNHLTNMVEELLYIIITCVSEPGNARQLPLPVSIRRELIHALAVGPCCFTDLCKRVAERMIEDYCFEHVLLEVAHFKLPETTTDTGLYELKDECLDEVNPYFYHYTRNKREEVEAVLKARLKKRTGVADPIIVPKPLDIPFGPFVNLTMVFQSSVLHQIIFFLIYNVLNQTEMTGIAPASAEAILDQALHLIMLGLVEQPQPFSQLAAHKTFDNAEEQSLIHVLCILEHHDSYKTLKPKVEWCLDNFSRHVPSTVIERRKVPDALVKSSTVEDTKKRAAKARQDAIMKQFAAAQKTFLDNIDDVEEDEDMEDAAEPTQSYGACIVCQEDLDNTRSFGTLGLVQASKLIRRVPEPSPSYMNETLASFPSLDRVPPVDWQTHNEKHTSRSVRTADSSAYPAFDGFPRQHVRFGLHGSVCGHMMHLECFSVYAASIRQRHRAQAQRNHPENIQRKEYVCPLCKSLGNVILPVVQASDSPFDPLPFPDWVRTTGINLLRSAPDRLLESLQFKSGTGEFVFWTAQDSGYYPYPKHSERFDPADTHKMVDTVMVITRTISSQSRHLRDRVEQEPGDRGAGMYLPEDLVVYTLATMEISTRGSPALPEGSIADQVSESQLQLVRGLVACLTKLASIQFKDRADGGRDAIRQAIVKRLLPEWRREPAFNSPLLLREPLTILVETAAVSPKSLRYVTVLAYYASLARITIGIVQLLGKPQSVQAIVPTSTRHRELFGDLRTFVMSVVRHSPLLEHAAELVLETFGEERFAKLLHAYSLPFLRRAAILRKAVLPSSFSSRPPDDGLDEYHRLLRWLGIPPLVDLSNYDTIQNALSGWCAHYGVLHANHPLECVILMDYPCIYRLAQLPTYLDDLFAFEKETLVCPRCETVSQDPAICLICGTTVCFQSHCCVDTEARDRGECNMHTRDCGGVIGVYFLVKRCAILYLFAGNGSFAPAPYLDVHGEVDFSMRRGRRQLLHDIRAEEIRKLWLSHGIPTYIARKLDSTVDVGGWEQL